MTEKKFEIDVIRHSLSHVLAAAVMEMFPEAKLGIGPAIDNGFYYDFDLPRTLIPEDLPLLEEKMRQIIARDEKFVRVEIAGDEAIKQLAGQHYKHELIKELGDEKISIYQLNRSFDSAQDDSEAVNFIDLCKVTYAKARTSIRQLI
ncbi:MAG: hypothetical protein NTY30_00010 [Candidatus Berkelbacteria bacterium]|nr:hypothetical protein [Candidatus Berkelbacteria bacterium]